MGAHVGEIYIELPEGAADNGKRRVFHRRTDPRPSDTNAAELFEHPGMAFFIAATRALAEAATELMPVLVRFGEPTQYAETVIAMGQVPSLPTREQYDATLSVERSLVSIDTRVDNGALSGDEDSRERRAFWTDVLAGIKNARTREDLTPIIEGLLREPRVPERELQYLDAVRARERSDEVEASLQEVLDLDQSTNPARAQRWNRLKEWGVWRVAETIDGKVTIDVSMAARALRMYSDATPTVELRWLKEFLTATDALHEPAVAAGFSPEGRIPIHRLVRKLRDAHKRVVDVHEDVEAVALINDELARHSGQPVDHELLGGRGAVPEVPVLRQGQMPARVLVTLLTHGGGMAKRELHRLHRGNGKDDPILANLLTPSGTLAVGKLIVADGLTVVLTPEGKREAKLQAAVETLPLGRPAAHS